MELNRHVRQAIALWLTAILLLLSVAASAHSVTHLDDGANSHCTLCIQHHQFKQLLTSQPLLLKPLAQPVEPLVWVLVQFLCQHVGVYLSRGPPVVL
ncbi:MAG: ABC-type zinc uptake system zinc chaperone [Shewanella sp.]